MKFLHTLGLIAAFVLSMTVSMAQARTDVDGFKGMRWGSPLSELQRTKKLVLTKESDASGESLYALQNESLRFGKATLTGISCSFNQDRLQGVILLFAGANNFAAVKTEATARFGESRKIEQKGEEMYTWAGEITSTVLSYNRGSQSGFLFMKPKKPLPKVKVQAKSPAKPQPPAKPTPPAVHPLDSMETALDRAPMPEQPGTVQGLPAASPAPVPATTSSSSPLPTPAPQSPRQQALAVEDVNPEVQGLIDRDQALTRLCWDTVGPSADDACLQMRTNAQRLQELGWCMKPDDAGGAAAGVVWQRCGSASQVATTPPPPPTQPAGQINREAVCRTVGELFTKAAWMRDDGATPVATEEELLRSENSRGGQVGIERIRETVELIYFDPDYAGMRGSEITHRVEDDCLSGFGPYNQPLFQVPRAR